MFSSIGWGEIFVILVFGFIIVGPERLPELVKDVRAAIYAARKAINNAKKELDGTIGEEFKEPISKVAQMRKMTPKGMLSKALFDDDESFLDDLDPRKMLDLEGSPSLSGKTQSYTTVQPHSARRGVGAVGAGGGVGASAGAGVGVSTGGGASKGTANGGPAGSTAAGAAQSSVGGTAANAGRARADGTMASGSVPSSPGSSSSSTTSYSDPSLAWDDIT